MGFFGVFLHYGKENTVAEHFKHRYYFCRNSPPYQQRTVSTSKPAAPF